MNASIKRGDCLYQGLFSFDAFKWNLPLRKSSKSGNPITRITVKGVCWLNGCREQQKEAKKLKVCQRK